MLKLLPLILLLFAFPIKNFISLNEAVGNFSAGQFYFFLTVAQLAFIGLPIVYRLQKGQFLLSRNINILALMLYMAFVGYMALVVFSHGPMKAFVGEQERNAISYWAPILIGYVSFFIAGMYLRSIDGPVARMAVLIALVAVVAQSLAYTDFAAMRLDFSQYVENEIVGTYLFLADSLAMTAFLAIAAFRSIHIKVVIYALALVALFVLNSRTSFFLFAILFPVLFWHNRAGRALYGVLGIVAVAGMAALYSDQITAIFQQLRTENARMFAIFDNIGGDESAIERARLFQVGWEAILNNPVVGQFGGQIQEGQRWNDYIHSSLSYWRQFGVFAAIALLILYIGVVKTWLKTFAGPYSSAAHFFLLCSVFFMASSLFSRAYVFPEIHFVFGLAMMQAARLRY